MAKESIDALVEGGKATAAPPLGPALGPLGVNIGQVVAEINKKTESFKGMKVPVKVIVDADTKLFEIEIGTPPVSQLILKELNLTKGSGEPEKNKIGNIGIEQVIKIAKMKIDSMFTGSLKSAVKSIAGSANSLGVLVEGKNGHQICEEINQDKYDDAINNEVTEIADDKSVMLKEQLDIVQKSLAGLRATSQAKVAAEAEKEKEKKEKKEGEAKEGEKKEEKGAKK